VGDYTEAFVALDTSKLRNAVAIAEVGRSGEVRFLGEIENTAAATGKLVKKLAGKYDRLAFCYEAGPTGYGLYRQITGLGHECVVAAPALIPKKAGDRVKTNRRDALGMVKQFRAGELTAVGFPIRATRRCATSPGRAAQRWRICAPSASRCCHCCCGSACIIRERRPGPGRT
jgi:transposase